MAVPILIDCNKQQTILGINFHALTRSEMIQRIDMAISKRQPIWLTFINVAILVQIKLDSKLRSILYEANYRLCDGMGIMYASRLLGNPLPETVGGMYLLFQLLRHAEVEKYKVYFLGCTQDTINKVVANVRITHPSLKIVGYHHGYFGQKEEPYIVNSINKSGADLLFVGMGFPRERIFLRAYRHVLNVLVCMDVGGAFTVISGVHRLAPRWMSVLGMEWIYRLLQEPKRLWKRYFTTNALFLCFLLRELLKRALTGSKNEIK